MKKLKIGDKAPDFIYETPWGKGLKFSESSAGKPSVLMFVRYLGCPICQTDIENLKNEIGIVEQGRENLYVVLQGSPETLASLTEKEEWPFAVIIDHDGRIFRQYRVDPEGIIKYLHPAGLIAAVRATVQGYRNGRFEGRETQLPAVFIVDQDGTIRLAHYGDHFPVRASSKAGAARVQRMP